MSHGKLESHPCFLVVSPFQGIRFQPMFMFLLQPPSRQPIEEFEMSDFNQSSFESFQNQKYQNYGLFGTIESYTSPSKQVEPPIRRVLTSLVLMPPLLNKNDIAQQTRVNGFLISTAVCIELSLKPHTNYIHDPISGIIIKAGGPWNGVVVYSTALPTSSCIPHNSNEGLVNGRSGLRDAVVTFLDRLNVKGLNGARGLWIDSLGNVGREDRRILLCNWKDRVGIIRDMGLIRR
jgi:hypothetical protein